MTAERTGSGDAAARRAAVTLFDRPLAVEAGAGTGKTSLLVARILGWTLDAGWDDAASPGDRPDEADRRAERVLAGVVAITFTEAAAAEVATRLGYALQMVARGEESEVKGLDLVPWRASPDERRRRAPHLLGALDRLTVATIHAFCRGLLARHPLAAGMHPDFTVDADLVATEEIVREIVEAHLATAYAAPGDPDLLALAEVGEGPAEIAEELLRLLAEAVPAAALERDPFAAGDAEAAWRRLLAACRNLLTSGGDRLHRLPDRSKARQVVTAIEQTLALEGAPPITTPAEAIDRSRALAALWEPGLRTSDLSRWARGGFRQYEHTALDGGEREVAAAAETVAILLAHLANQRFALFERARHALAPLLAECRRAMARRGVATFSDLLFAARDLLFRRPDVAAQERRSLRQLLVDEFQDTDPVQCETIGLLALTGPPPERPGLFVVGDPQQSVFGWRRADLVAYEHFLRRISEAGGEIHRLDLNFRSRPGILREVERCMRRVMIEEPGLQPPHTPLVADRPEAPGPLVEHWVSWDLDAAGDPTPASASASAQLEAAAIAHDLRRLHDDESVEWHRVGILLRTTSHLEEVLEALRAAEIPFAVTRDRGFYLRREVIEATGLLRTIVHPEDHVALLTFLRSPLAGVPDAALLPLWRRGLPGRVTDLGRGEPAEEAAELAQLVAAAAAELPADIPGLARIAGWEDALLDSLATLADLRRSFRQETGDRFLARVRETTLVEVSEAARYQGRFRLANLDRLFDDVARALEEHSGDAGTVLRALGRSLERREEAEEARPLGDEESRVEVTTIHKAKGREFDHVYLAQAGAPNRTPRPPRGRAVPSGGAPGAWDLVLLGAAAPGFDRVDTRDRRVAAAELVRTLYVAMTRARERLVVLAPWPEAPAPPGPAGPRSHLDLLQSRPELPATLSPLAAGLAEDGVRGGAAAELFWRFPGLEDRRSRSAARRSESPTLSSSSVLRSSRRLLDLRRAAELYRERPLGDVPSAATPGSAPGAVAVATAPDRAPSSAPRWREAAQAAGAMLHAALEGWDCERPPAEEAARWRHLGTERIRRDTDPATATRAAARFQELLERWRDGNLLARFRSVGATARRELPLILSPASIAEGPVGFVSGSIDLVYRDPESDAWVVADYKSDRLEDAALSSRAAAYVPQLSLYREAVRRALDLSSPPRAEIWFLWADAIVAVE